MIQLLSGSYDVMCSMSVCLPQSLCLLVILLICLLVILFICLFICLLICPLICLLICLLMCLSYMSLFMPLYMPNYMSLNMPLNMCGSMSWAWVVACLSALPNMLLSAHNNMLLSAHKCVRSRLQCVEYCPNMLLSAYKCVALCWILSASVLICSSLLLTHSRTSPPEHILAKCERSMLHCEYIEQQQVLCNYSNLHMCWHN